MSPKPVIIDVREDLRLGRDPFPRIMQRLDALGAHETLLLVAPAQPVALIEVLAERGFIATPEQSVGDEWQARISRREALPRTAAPAIELDARRLEPPQPMMRILEALEDLAPDGELRARTDRRPMHLYPMLTARGFNGQTEEQPDGTFLTRIRHR